MRFRKSIWWKSVAFMLHIGHHYHWLEYKRIRCRQSVYWLVVDMGYTKVYNFIGSELLVRKSK